MPSFNKWIGEGNLTRDVDVRFSPNGTAIANFSLAINRKYKQDNETKEECSFFDVVAFGKTAETCGKYLGKGSCVLVEGRLQQRRWQTDDGQNRSKVEIVAQNVVFQGGKKSDSPVSTQHDDVLEVGEQEIPF
jgi:single-strand DNA-binding protein